MIKRFLFYIKARRATKNIIDKIRKIDDKLLITDFRLRMMNVKNKLGAITIDNGKIILKLNPNEIKDDFIMNRIITHELVHLWIGSDLRTGVSYLPQHIKGIDKHFGIYKSENLSLRMQLYCFIYQQFKFKNRLKSLTKLDKYDDFLFHSSHNPYESFEEILVNFVTMKLWGDSLDTYPVLESIFRENRSEKELLVFADDVMPNIRLAIKKLVEEF